MLPQIQTQRLQQQFIALKLNQNPNFRHRIAAMNKEFNIPEVTLPTNLDQLQMNSQHQYIFEGDGTLEDKMSPLRRSSNSGKQGNYSVAQVETKEGIRTVKITPKPQI